MDNSSLAHSKWNCKYYIVCYRKRNVGKNFYFYNNIFKFDLSTEYP